MNISSVKAFLLLEEAYEVARVYGHDELCGSLAEYLAYARGELSSFDEIDEDVVREVDAIWDACSAFEAGLNSATKLTLISGGKGD